MTIKGQPCKERQSTVVWEHSSSESAKSDASIEQRVVDTSSSGLEVVKLCSATRNPCSHLAEAIDYVLQNRPQDGELLVEHIRAHMKRRDETKAKNKKRTRTESNTLTSWLVDGKSPGSGEAGGLAGGHGEPRLSAGGKL